MRDVSDLDRFVMGETNPCVITEKRFHPRFIQQQVEVAFLFVLVWVFVSFLIIPAAYFTFFLASSDLTSPQLSGIFWELR